LEPHGFYLDVGQTGNTLCFEYDRNSDSRVHMLRFAAPESWWRECVQQAWEDRLEVYDDFAHQDLVVPACPASPEPGSLIPVRFGIAGLAVDQFRKLV
jgi:hypothetical protein